VIRRRVDRLGCRPGPGPAGWPGRRGMRAARSRPCGEVRSTRARAVGPPSRAAGCVGPGRPIHRHRGHRADRREPSMARRSPRPPPWLPRPPPLRHRLSSPPRPPHLQRPPARHRTIRHVLSHRLPPRRPPRRSPPGSCRPRRSVPSALRPVPARPRGEPNPGRSGRPETRSRGNTPPGERGLEGRVERRHNNGGGDPGPTRARLDHPRTPRTGRPKRRPREAVRVQSPGDDTGPLSPRPSGACSHATSRERRQRAAATPIDRPFPARRA
jgi:hypothetical protein